MAVTTFPDRGCAADYLSRLGFYPDTRNIWHKHESIAGTPNGVRYAYVRGEHPEVTVDVRSHVHKRNPK